MVLLPVQRVAQLCDPFSNPWTSEAFSVEDVLLALAQQRTEPSPYSKSSQVSDWTVNRHVERIAYLVQHGWSDPLEIDVGIPNMGFEVAWPVQDGNHRLAAAIVRGDAHIGACVSGDIDYALELFGVDVAEVPA